MDLGTSTKEFRRYNRKRSANDNVREKLKWSDSVEQSRISEKNLRRILKLTKDQIQLGCIGKETEIDQIRRVFNGTGRDIE